MTGAFVITTIMNVWERDLHNHVLVLFVMWFGYMFSRLPDGHEVEWNEDVIGEYVLAAVKKHTIKQVRT